MFAMASSSQNEDGYCCSVPGEGLNLADWKGSDETSSSVTWKQSRHSKT